MDDYEDDFIRIRKRLDQYAPEIWHRELERVKVGTWFFGLLPVYEYRYTEWKKNHA
jgi:hypothetical protein